MRGLLYIFSRRKEMWVRQAGRRSQRRTKNDLEWAIAAETPIGLQQNNTLMGQHLHSGSSSWRREKNLQRRKEWDEVLLLILAPVEIYLQIEQKLTQERFSVPSTYNTSRSFCKPQGEYLLTARTAGSE